MIKFAKAMYALTLVSIIVMTIVPSFTAMMLLLIVPVMVGVFIDCAALSDRPVVAPPQKPQQSSFNSSDWTGRP